MFISKKKYKALLIELENAKNVVNERRLHETELQMQEYLSRITNNLDEEVPFYCDKDKLSSLLQNLLSFPIRFR